MTKFYADTIWPQFGARSIEIEARDLEEALGKLQAVSIALRAMGIVEIQVESIGTRRIKGRKYVGFTAGEIQTGGFK